ncbi:hypothetical protein U3516DRAFT_751061 [Neocallimastix sp. 'constans']
MWWLINQNLIPELFSKYNDIFTDGTFSVAPKFSYQIFVERTYILKTSESYNNYLKSLFSEKKNPYIIMIIKEELEED